MAPMIRNRPDMMPVDAGVDGVDGVNLDHQSRNAAG